MKESIQEGVYNSGMLSPDAITQLTEKYHIGHDGEYFQITGDDGTVHNIPSRVEVPHVNGPIPVEERIQQVIQEVRTSNSNQEAA